MSKAANVLAEWEGKSLSEKQLQGIMHLETCCLEFPIPSVRFLFFFDFFFYFSFLFFSFLFFLLLDSFTFLC